MILVKIALCQTLKSRIQLKALASNAMQCLAKTKNAYQIKRVNIRGKSNGTEIKDTRWTELNNQRSHHVTMWSPVTLADETS